MEYNELKKFVLEILSDGKWRVSEDIFTETKDLDYKAKLNALRMALMRYYRQGIIKRRRRSGAYEYRISNRGLERLAWLKSLKGESVE